MEDLLIAYKNKIHFQNPVELDLYELSKVFISDVLPRIEKKYGIRALMGNVDGSLSRGMSNASSDIDIRLYCDSEDLCLDKYLVCEEIVVEKQKYTLEISLHNISKSIDSLRLELAKEKKYPTCFFRKENEETDYSEENATDNIRQNKDYEFYELFSFLSSDVIFSMENNIDLEWIKDNFLVIDALDNQFIRAYGNYNKTIKDKESIVVRKYLNTLWEILYCEWVLDVDSVPPYNINTLIEKSNMEKTVKSEIEKVFEHNNKNIIKEKNFMPKSKVLNAYINEKIGILDSKIRNYDKSRKWNSLNCRDSKKEMIYF